MEREQIIKALECCSTREDNCDHCPLDKLNSIDCRRILHSLSLSLIKELTEVAERREGVEESPVDSSTPSVTEPKRENERLIQALTAKGYRKQEDVLQELNDEVVKKYMEERSVFLEERKNVGEGDGVFWYIQGRIDGMEWVKDTVRFTKNEMIDQIAKRDVGGREMSKNFVLTDGQTGYEVIGDYIQRYWENKFYATVIVSVCTSYDGEYYRRYKTIASPLNYTDIEYMDDWWEGEKYIKLEGIVDVEDVYVNGGIFEPSERSENGT